MRKITTTVLGLALGLVPSLVAQDEAAAKRAAEEKAQIRMQMDAVKFKNQTFEYVGAQLLGGNPVKGAPYSAEAVTETTQTLADGNRIVHRASSNLYRDSEGRERREESFEKLGAWNAEGEPAKAIFISDPVAKVSYSLDTKGRTARKMPAPFMAATTKREAESSARMITRGPVETHVAITTSGRPGDVVYSYNRVTGTDKPPAKVEHLGKRMIEGVEAEGTRTTVTIPAGQIGNEKAFDIVSERWYSAELQMTVLSRHSDPRTGENVYKITNVNRSEPLRSMFEVPADYTVTEAATTRVHRQE